MELPEIQNKEAIGSGIHINHEVSRRHFEGRDLSKFDQDILKILCVVLDQVGPIRFSSLDVEKVDTNELVLEARQEKDMFIVMMVKPHGASDD